MSLQHASSSESHLDLWPGKRTERAVVFILVPDQFKRQLLFSKPINTLDHVRHTSVAGFQVRVADLDQFPANQSLTFCLVNRSTGHIRGMPRQWRQN